MFLLTAATTIDPNTAAIVGYAVMAIALVLAVLIAVALVKTILKKLKKAAPAEAVESAPDAVAALASPSATAPGSAGQIKLNNVDPKTAAMLMAIVADKTGKPLNELRFISVKEIK